MAFTSTDLEAIEDAIRARIAGGAVKSYTIAGRNIQHYDLNDLYDIRDKMKADINRTGSGVSPRSSYASFKNRPK